MMDLIKKNVVSVLCGVVAIICVILIFFPFGGMYETLRENVKKSWTTGENIRTVMNKPRTWPSLSSKEEDKLPLEQFPTAAIYNHGKSMTTDWNNQATLFLQVAIDAQKKQLQPLVPGALPSLNSPAVGRAFIDNYQRKFGIYLTASGAPDESISIFKQTLDSTMPPSDLEVKAELDRVADEIARARTIWQGAAIVNADEVKQLIAERQAQVAEQLRSQKAAKHLVYANPALAFEVNPKISGSQTPGVNDVFLAQATLWVQEQIANAIRETNESAHKAQQSRSAGILRSPIKHLLHVKITNNPFLPVKAITPGEAPVLLANPNVKIVPDYTAGAFGHSKNEFYDVLKFETAFICDASLVTQVLTGLNREHYFIFSQVSVQSVDSSIDAAQGFLYGDSPVVQVTIKGNYLFLREFMKAYMPVDIIRGLAVPAGTITDDRNSPGDW